jgi:hypothetical protein
MNTKMNRNDFLRRVRMTALLLAAIMLSPASRAQPTEQTVQSRFLFIFDTSSDMKNCVDGVQRALNTMLATSMNGQLHAGESMGVWTFSQDLRPGDFPLQSWYPGDAVQIASKITSFIGGQHYTKSARFAALQPLLNRVVQGSERLTVVIFCSGAAQVSGTPFDAGINQIFQEKLEKQKSAHQPFVIVLRAQLGQYISCNMGLPPQPVIFSGFPPLPEPPPAPKPTNIPPPAPAIAVPPLIIIGKKSESSPASPSAALTNSLTVTNPSSATEPALPPVISSPAAPGGQTNASTVPPANPLTTNLTTQTIPETNATTPTGAPASSVENSDTGNKGLIAIGSGLLGAAIALGIVFWLRSRRKDPSLITRSMNDRK